MKAKLLRPRVSIQHMHGIYACVSTLLICVLFFCIGFSSYTTERNRLMQESRESYANVVRAYEEKCDKFWRLYMPVVSNKDLEDVFLDLTKASHTFLSYQTRKKVCLALEQMQLVDDDIVAFVLHPANDANYDYIYYVASKSLQVLEKDSPFRKYFDEMDSNSRVLTGIETLELGTDGSSTSVYGICGGFSKVTPCTASLMVLYQTSPLISAGSSVSCAVPSDTLLLTTSERIVFSTVSTEDFSSLHTADFSGQDTVTLGGTTYFCRTESVSRGRVLGVCLTPRAELIRLANKNTLLFCALCLLVCTVNVFFHLYTGYLNAKRAKELISGIERLGQQDLSFRFEVRDTRDEYERIARCINSMAEAMQRNIDLVFIHSLREKEAEMGELQSKFNPHFLYNTLEVIRTHLQQKGDSDTAGMILLLARIFRSSIDSSHFTTLRKECTFINGYLDLYRWRYKDSFDVIYDMDPEILECGIIRNLLQPLIENYFVHGFSPEIEHNELVIKGEAEGDSHILLTVEDNGTGICEEKLRELQASLASCNRDVKSTASYGLKNISDRIRLFYGADCGLSVTSVPNEKTTIRLRIRRMTLSEHESWIRAK